MAEPLILVPGLACDAQVWRDVIAALPTPQAAFVPKRPRHGGLESWATALLAAAPAGRFALAGHSMGGRIALEVLRQAPERVSRIALLDTGWQPRPAGPAGEAEREQRLALLALARREGMRAMARRWAADMVHPARHAEPLFDAVLDMVARHTADDFEVQIQALLARPDAADVLAAIDVPALVLCGRQDGWSPLARHEAMAARLRRARLSVVEDCGHMSPMERPAAVAQALAGWLAEMP